MPTVDVPVRPKPRSRDEVRERARRHCREMLAEHVLVQVLDEPKFKAFYLKDPQYSRMQSCLILFSPEGINLFGDLCPSNDRRSSGVHAFGYGLSWFAGNLSWDYLASKFLEERFVPEFAAVELRQIAHAIRMGEARYSSKCDDAEEIDRLINVRHALASDLRDCLYERRQIKAGAYDEELTKQVQEQLAREVPRIRAKGQESREHLRRLTGDLAERWDELACSVEHGSVSPDELYRELSDLGYEIYDGIPGYSYDPHQAALLEVIQERFAELYRKMRDERATAVGSVDLAGLL